MTKVHEVKWVNEVHRVKTAKMDQQVLPVNLVLEVHPAQLVSEVVQGHQVFQVQKVIKDTQAETENQVNLAKSERKVKEVFQATVDQ